MKNEVFRAYLQRRYQAAGAVTPEQQLEVLNALVEEAHQGIVPIDVQHVARLDPQDPAVQAVLRGEAVVVSGRRTVESAEGWRQRVVDLPGWAKILVLVAIGLLPTLAGSWLIVSGFSRSSPPAATSTPPQTEVAVAPTVVDQRPAIARNTVIEDLSDVPVSLEIGDLRILLQPRWLSDGTGMSTRLTDWKPTGGEWLVGSRVRRVIAVPESVMDFRTLSTGQTVVLRYQNGHLVSFIITFIGRVSVDQIEVMRSGVPSLVVIRVTSDPVWREVLIAEQSELVLASTPAGATPEPPRTAVTRQAVRLREGPSLSAPVLKTLEAGTVVVILSDQEAVRADGYLWVHVRVGDAMGWVVNDYLKQEASGGE